MNLITLKKLNSGAIECDIDYTDDVIVNTGLILYFISKNLEMSKEELLLELEHSLATWEDFSHNNPNCLGLGNE